MPRQPKSGILLVVLREAFLPFSTFSGTFDDNGKKISNLYINRASEENVGMLFRTVNRNVETSGISECRCNRI